MQLPLRARHVIYRAYDAIRAPFAARDIILWPPVMMQEKLDDLTARVRFHFPEGFKITIPHAPGLREPQSVPWYLTDARGRFKSATHFREVKDESANALALAFRHRGVLLTRPAEEIPFGKIVRYLPNGAPLDPTDVEMETFWLSKFYYRQQSEQVVPSRRRFEAYVRNLPQKKKVYLLCTGPSLSRFAEFDFSDGYVIGCNTVVSNEALMNHAKPEFIVASDPIFHFGPGIYAERFRQDLAAAAKKSNFLFLTLNTYHHILKHHLPLGPERIAEVPLRLNTEAISLNEKWSVPQTANILTMFMLPLARALAKDIYIIGADGREPGETYFWKHDPSSQLTDKMQAIKAAHPAFFAKRDYEDYYDRHCGILAREIETIESNGGHVYTLTPSFVPALQKRPAPK